MTSSTAIIIKPNGDLSLRQIDERYKPQGSQSLVQVEYSAINPADIRHSYMGLDNSVAGYEWTGKVLEKGETSPFSIGQQLFGMSMPAPNRPISAGAHQNYILAEDYMTWPVPPTLDPKHAVTLTIGIQTATDALFNILGYAFPPTSLPGRSPNNTPLLIWGGSSTVGYATIQLAKAAGFHPILTTASPRNHPALLKIGATQTFDYRDPNVVQNIRSAIAQSGQQLTTIVDAVSAGLGVYEPEPAPGAPPLDLSQSSPSLARQCCSNPDSNDLLLSSVLPVAHDPAWTFCLGVRLPGDETMGIRQDPEWAGRIAKVMSWVVQNPGVVQSLPNISVVHGAEEGMRQMGRVFRGEVSMEKVLIGRPL